MEPQSTKLNVFIYRLQRFKKLLCFKPIILNLF